MQLHIEEDKSQDHCIESGRTQNFPLNYLKSDKDQSNCKYWAKRQEVQGQIWHHLRSDFDHYP